VLREDLYYRLQANVLRVPALRERLDDVPALVDHFITLFNERLGREMVTDGIEQQALDAMCQYAWPGNVRELANAVESAMTFGKEPLIRLEDLPATVNRRQTSHQTETAIDQCPPTAGTGTFAQVERALILRALEACDWNKVHAADMLKISRKKLYAKIAKFQLDQFRTDRSN
jgi:DNA-binding NtrC family response regulator